jgi:hypothetical protein
MVFESLTLVFYIGRNNQIILNSYNQSKVFSKNNQENNQADYFYQTGPKLIRLNLLFLKSFF